MEESSNSKDAVISNLLIRNQQLSQEVKRLNRENASFEGYVVDTITSSRHGDDIGLKLTQIHQFCHQNALSHDKLPLYLQDELHKLIERKKEIEDEITRTLHFIKGGPQDRWGMVQVQSDFLQLNLNGDVK
jgi:hypothetical protein